MLVVQLTNQEDEYNKFVDKKSKEYEKAKKKDKEKLQGTWKSSKIKNQYQKANIKDIDRMSGLDFELYL